VLKTYSPKKAELEHDWYLIDASDLTLGRLATIVATRLQGKHKPTYAPHLDCGDNLVIINTAKVRVTGNKLVDKKYYRHSGYPGGIKEETLEELQSREPNQVIFRAVKGMLPKNRLQDARLSRLKLFAGSEHEHTAQKPRVLNLKESK
jgi:large subunit ribosomal protein L13